MSRFTMQESDNYGQNNAGSFFSLKDDGDTARVRFLYNTIDDVEGYAVHQVEIGDRTRYVNCLRAYNEPLEKCPFCAAKMRITPKLFLKVYNEDTQECQIWERGKAYFQRIAGLAARYNPLVNEIVEIERHGKKGDKQTNYEFFPVESSPVNLDDFDCTEPLGTIIMDKTADEMEEFLAVGSFPDTATNVAQTRNEQRQETYRRTPGNTNAGRRAF